MMTTKELGVTPETTLDSIISTLQCPVCLDLAENAMELSCCHALYCEFCINGIANKTCPSCRHPSITYTPSIMGRRLIGSMVINCPLGCGATLPKSNMKSHANSCAMKQYECNQKDCKFKATKDEFVHHIVTSHTDQLVATFSKIEEVPSKASQQQVGLNQQPQQVGFSQQHVGSIPQMRFNQLPSVANTYPNHPYLAKVLQAGVKVTELMGKINQDSQFFDDYHNVVCKTGQFPKVAGVTVCYNQAHVIGIQFSYRGLTNNYYGGCHMGTASKTDRQQVALQLDVDEYITEVSGRCGDIIDHLIIKTSKGKSLSAGGFGGNEHANLLPNTGFANQIVGIGGATNGDLHNIYLYYLN